MATDQPWWYQGCLENIQKIPGGVMCSENHCTDAQNYSHQVCTCTGAYPNGCVGKDPTSGCCSYTATSPVFVANAPNCYCCCGCFSNDTQVAIDEIQTKAIQEFIVGDLVYVADDASLKSWSQQTVQFSAGTGLIGIENTLIKISFGDKDKPGNVICSRAQLFLTPERKLIRAAKLVPGEHQLLTHDGTPVMVLDLTVGKFKKGVHQIATSLQPTTNVDQHLILANGIVSGDYALQITNLEGRAPEVMIDGYADLPDFGTRDYIENNKQLLATSFRAHPPKQVIEHTDGELFRPLGEKGPIQIPADAQSFVTLPQAEDLKEFAPHAPIHSGAGIDIYNYLTKLFGGFFNDVVFYLDEENELPNAYSWIELGVPFVVVTGGLLRTDAVKFESLALVLAHELGHLYGGPPLDKAGYTCTGMADYVAISGIFPYIWFGIYSAPMTGPAIEQVTALFSYIQPEHRYGKPGNTCNLISIDCRLSAMEAARNTRALPHCAGGPPDPTLKVVGASAVTDDQGPLVTVSYNENVNKASAEAVGNYAFQPLATATNATVDSADPSKVNLRVAIDQGVEYTVTVFGVLSENMDPLIVGYQSANFELT